MIDPIQSQIVAAPPASSSDPSRLPTASSASASASAPGAQKGIASPTGDTLASGRQAPASGGASEAQPAPDAAQPLRLLIEHDKATNHYVYKLYDSSGRVVREIPQESLADAQKQASGSAGTVIDTKV